MTKSEFELMDVCFSWPCALFITQYFGFVLPELLTLLICLVNLTCCIFGLKLIFTDSTALDFFEFSLKNFRKINKILFFGPKRPFPFVLDYSTKCLQSCFKTYKKNFFRNKFSLLFTFLI